MRSYRQYCPIARASEILATRWTPIVLRNLLSGAETFSALAAGAPGMSRTLLSTRLRELDRAGMVDITGKEHGAGSRYRPTDAAKALGPVLLSLGQWAEQWLDLDPTSSDPGFLLHNWCTRYLDVDALPDHRVVVRFDFADQPPAQQRLWVIFDRDQAEVCLTYPDEAEALVVRTESTTLAAWHLGRIEWPSAVADGRIVIDGAGPEADELPTWNRRSLWAHRQPLAAPTE